MANTVFKMIPNYPLARTIGSMNADHLQTRPIAPLRLLASAALSLLIATSIAPASAQQGQKQQWYQIELVVFANTNPAAAETEQWPQELGLKYPKNIISFQQNSATAEIDRLLANAATNDDASTLPVESTEQLAAAQTVAALPSTVAQTKQEGEQVFVLLASSAHRLGQAVNKIVAQADFRLLFHGAWRQVIGRRHQSASLLIRGGDAYDQHYELEGSINLSVERYLHINTDLWLSTFERNISGEQQLWPVLPPVPLQQATATNPRSSLFTAGLSDQQPMTFNTTGESTLGDSLQQSLQNSYDSLFADMRANQYTVKQTVVMRQHRRMRSNELHYIDHPLMGLLIKVTPYEPPEQSIASDETVNETTTNAANNIDTSEPNRPVDPNSTQQ